MNGISLPVVLLRRLVNVISTLSLSNQYLKQASVEEKSEVKQKKWSALNSLGILEWRWMLGHTTDPASSPGSTMNSFNDSSSVLLMSDLETHHEIDNSDDLPVNQVPKPREPPKRAPPEPRRPEVKQDNTPQMDPLHQLLYHPALFDPIRTPRYPIVLSHGLYGFDTRGPTSFPSMRMHYWSNVLNILRKHLRAEVIITSVPGTGSIVARSEALDKQLQSKARGRGLNLLAHSMGGLDCRHLISHIKPTEYVPLSLTTVSTPHRGSPFMDWCAENIGLGKLKREEFLSRSASKKLVDAASAPTSSTQSEASAKAKDSSFSFSQLPSSFATLVLGLVDSPAYANLTTSYLNDVFNPQTPNDPSVKYFSVAGRMPSVSIWHPFWLPKMVLDGAEEKERERLRTLWEKNGGTETDPLWRRAREWGNDGLVTVQSAQWGEFLGIMEGCDHWEMRGARGIEFGVDLPALPAIGLSGPNPTPTSSGDGWGLMDWGRFVRARKKEENVEREGNAAASSASAKSATKEDAEEAAALKQSSDKIASVFDWLVEQVPSPPKFPLGGKDAKVEEDEKHMKEEGKETRKKSELAKKEDLRRFYVALSRKMYEEGL
ncbi:ubiquitin-related modifier 1 [Favolaschia claudopus]|uniref:Ubiquitin-related modifier 1 n=1 Tax=Favolaschia claudopus TaxID=2862362 RepID=A0AAW0CVA2_9AGAR